MEIETRPIESTETRAEYQKPHLEQHQEFTAIVGASV